MLRAIILVLVLFVAVGTIIPLATDYAEAGAKKTEWRITKKKKRYKKYRRYITTEYVKGKKITKKYRKPKKYKGAKKYSQTKKYRSSKKYRKVKRTAKRYKTSKRYKTAKRYRSTKRYKKSGSSVKAKNTRRVRRYSKKWWSNYRSKTRRNKVIAKRKQDLRLRRIRLAKQKPQKRISTPRVSNTQVISISGNAVLPGWMKEKLKNEVRSKTATAAPNNPQTPQANSDLIIVTNAVSSESGRKNVAGVAISDLRKTVIDKMIQEQGWVVNDMEKYINGKKVYVVVAKSPGEDGAVRSRIFYFAESKGQIYSLSTVAPDDSNTQIANQSEKLVKTLQDSGGSVQSAKKD